MNKRIAELSLLALIAFGTAVLSRAESVEIKRDGDHINGLIGGHPFTSYYFGAATAKPYLFPSRSALPMRIVERKRHAHNYGGRRA